MAKKAMINKQQRPQKYATREYTRCSICGRPHAVLKNKSSSLKLFMIKSKKFVASTLCLLQLQKQMKRLWLY